MDSLTEVQKERLDEFGKIMEKKDVVVDEAMLIRYLKARNFQVTDAAVMLEKSIQWRQEKKPETYTHDSDCVKHILPLKGMFAVGKSKKGMPVMYVVPGAVNDNPVEEKVDFLMWTMEQVIGCMDVGVEKMIVIFDFKDYGKRGRSPDGFAVAKQSLSMLQNHYPERLGYLFVINSPWTFNAIWYVIRPFLNHVTREKIHFINGTRDEIGKILLEHISDDNLGSEYGGSLAISEEMKLNWAKILESNSAPSNSAPA